MSVSTVVKNATHTVGEGPHWEEATKSLLYVDILNGGIHRHNTVTGEETKLHLDGTVGFVVPSTKGDLIIGHNRNFSRLNWETQKVTKFMSVDDDLPNNRFNDGKCDPAGRLFAGTMDMETKPTILEPERGSLYCLDKDKTLTKVCDKATISNGLAWSSDHTVMYYIDSMPRKVYAFDYDKSTGGTSNRRTTIDFGKGTESSLGFPDGMTIDVEDKLWVACFHAAKVVRFDPETGKILREIAIPGLRTTSCCWGGSNYDELFVTCGKTGATEEELKKYPLSGSVFKVTELGVRGLPPTSYDG